MRKLISLTILLIICNTIDLFITIWALNHGVAEGNPLAVSYVGTWLHPICKFTAAVLVPIWMMMIYKRNGKFERAVAWSTMTTYFLMSITVVSLQIYGLNYFLRS